MERIWAVVSAKRDGWSVRQISKSVGLSPTRVHQLLAEPGAALMEHALSARCGNSAGRRLRTNGTPTECWWPLALSMRPRS